MHHLLWAFFPSVLYWSRCTSVIFKEGIGWALLILPVTFYTERVLNDIGLCHKCCPHLVAVRLELFRNFWLWLPQGFWRGCLFSEKWHCECSPWAPARRHFLLILSAPKQFPLGSFGKCAVFFFPSAPFVSFPRMDDFFHSPSSNFIFLFLFVHVVVLLFMQKRQV